MSASPRYSSARRTIHLLRSRSSASQASSSVRSRSSNIPTLSPHPGPRPNGRARSSGPSMASPLRRTRPGHDHVVDRPRRRHQHDPRQFRRIMSTSCRLWLMTGVRRRHGQRRRAPGSDSWRRNSSEAAASWRNGLSMKLSTREGRCVHRVRARSPRSLRGFAVLWAMTFGPFPPCTRAIEDGVDRVRCALSRGGSAWFRSSAEAVFKDGGAIKSVTSCR